MNPNVGTFRRLSLSLAVVAGVLPMITLALPAQEAPKKDAAQEYQALLDRVKKSDTTVDFRAMRRLQTELETYDPYASELEDRPFAALQKGDFKGTKLLAEQILAGNYLDLESHLALAQVAEKKGDSAAAAHHLYVAHGVLDSILQSGDGKSPGKAYEVIAISEEYAVMSHLGLRVEGQALVDSDGHSYDLLHGVGKNGERQDVYFNIDPLMTALNQQFSP